ncbi:MAG: DNA-3-methyladenine glycosylase [Solirubrobacteraceae bacterium]
MSRVSPGPVLGPGFFAAAVTDVAHALVGCVVVHGETAGVIVETEAYHQTEPACHAYVGVTPRTRTLFGPAGRAYVYRSYGIHALLNAVAEPDGTGAAVLIRALEPVAGLDAMRARRRVRRDEDLCSGPGKLTQALGVDLGHNGSDLSAGALRFHAAASRQPIVRAPRVGITKATELDWRFCAVGSRFVSYPRPAASRPPPRAPAPRVVPVRAG